MSNKSSIGARKAWKTLRLSLLWAKKGGLFRNRVEFSLSLLHKGIKGLRHSNDYQRGALIYGERELSFDETPTVHVKMHRPTSMRFKLPQIPCIKPEVDFDYDFDFTNDTITSIGHEDQKKCGDFDRRDWNEEMNREDCDDEEIDLKAEEFISKFHQQMRLQRQISLLQYNGKAQ